MRNEIKILLKTTGKKIQKEKMNETRLFLKTALGGISIKKIANIFEIHFFFQFFKKA